MRRLPAWRAAIRLARRDAWRNKGRSSLIALMVALPVLAAATASVIYQSQDWDVEDDLRADLGAAQARIYWQALNPIEQTPDGGGIGSASLPVAELEQLNPAGYGERLAGAIPAGDRLVAERWLHAEDELHWKGEKVPAEVRELDYTDAGIDGLVEQVSGRAPAAAGEVVVSQDLTWRGIEAGDTLTYQATTEGEPQTLTVVGVVDSYNRSGKNTIIGLPGTLLPEAVFALDRKTREQRTGTAPAVEWLVAGPQPVTWDLVRDLNTFGALVVSKDVVTDPPKADDMAITTAEPGGPDLRDAAVVAVLAGLALLQIALLAGPAIAVGARRNQRGLALMASAGAERRHLRSVVLAANGLIGLVSSVAAAALGAGLGVLVIAGARRWTDIDIIRTDIHLTDLLVLVLVGTGTTVAAALIPAYRVARLDVVATLTGRRRTRSSGPARALLPVVGGIVALAGLALAVRSTREFVVDPVQVVLGLALFEIGLVMTAGLVVAGAARFAGVLPFSLRFALRDASRQRSRTAPAVAAVLAAVAGGTAGLVYFASADQQHRVSYTGSGAIGVVTAISRNDTSAGTEVRTPSMDLAEAVLSKALGTEQIARFQVMAERDERRFVSLQWQTSPQRVCAGASSPLETCLWKDELVQVGTGDIFDDGTALQTLTGGRSEPDVRQLRAGKVVVPDPAMLRPDGTVSISVQRSTDGEVETASATLPAVLASGEMRLSSAILPPEAAKALGVELVPGGLVAKSPHPLTEDDAKAIDVSLRRTGEVASVHIERGYQSTYGLSILAVLVAAGVISLLGTFTAVGLAAAESRADLSTLAAVGAGPSLRRRLTAAQGGVIAGLGSILGVGSGVLAGSVLVRLARPDGLSFGDPGLWELVLPWPQLLVVGFGIPLLAMVVGFLTARSRMPAVRRIGL